MLESLCGVSFIGALNLLSTIELSVNWVRFCKLLDIREGEANG